MALADARARALLLVGLLAATLAAPAPARAWCQMTTSSRRPTATEPCVLPREGEHRLAWRRRCTEISLSRAAPSADLTNATVREVIARSIATWEAVTCEGARTDVSVTLAPPSQENECGAASHYTNGPNVHSLIFVADGWIEDRGHDARAFAVTLVWHDPASGEIWDVDMEMNEQRGTYAVCDAAGCGDGQVDLENVLTHEMGHYFGIAHTPDDSLATMWAMADLGETFKRDLRDDDVAALCGIYPPASLPPECDRTPRGGLSLSCERPSSCGCRVPGAARGGAGAALAWTAAIAIAIARRRRRG